MEEATEVRGGCLCRAIRYRAEVFLNCAYYCHCGICRRVTGQPSEIGVPVKPGTLKFTEGSPSFYRSSEFMKRGFCADCGSRIVNVPLDADDDWATNVAVCSLDAPELAKPFAHLHSEGRFDWYDPSPDLPHPTESELEGVFEEFKRRVGAS